MASSGRRMPVSSEAELSGIEFGRWLGLYQVVNHLRRLHKIGVKEAADRVRFGLTNQHDLEILDNIIVDLITQEICKD